MSSARFGQNTPPRFLNLGGFFLAIQSDVLLQDGIRRHAVLDHVASECGTPRIRVNIRIETSGRSYFVEKQ